MTFLAYDKVPEEGQRPVPSTLQSSFTAAIRPSLRSLYAVQSAIDWSKGEPTDDHLKGAIEQLDYQLSHPDFTTGQNVAQGAAGIAGMFLDPVSLVTGSLFGKVATKGVGLIGGYLPEYVSAISAGAFSKESISALTAKAIPLFENNKFAKYLPKSLNDTIEKVAQSTGIMTGFTLPESFLHNYDADTQRLDYGGLVKSVAFNGGIGMAIPPLAWTAGVILGKMGIATAKEFKGLSAGERSTRLQDALEKGAISQEEHNWLSDLYEKPEEVNKHLTASMKLLDKENHPVNAFSGKIEFPFMTQDEVKQIQMFALDEMASGNSENYKRGLTNFISHSMLDRMTKMLDENPSMFNGIKAHIEETESRLLQKIEQLKKEDIYINRTTPRSVTRSQPISQRNLYNMMQRGGLSKEEMPFIIPDRVRRLRNQEDRIKMLEQKSKNYEKEFDKTGRAKFKKLKEKNDKAIEREKNKVEKIGDIETQSQELKAIQERILGKEKLSEKYMMSRDYFRLLDLAHTYPQARALLRKIEIREQYEMQAAYNDVLRSIVKIAESGMGKFANPERVINYFKERIEGKADIESFKVIMNEKIAKVESDFKPNENKNVKNQFDIVNDNPNISSATKQEFNLIYTKLDQFKKGKTALNDMINCVLEAENVGIY
jgi:hypothetical protein